MELKPQKQVLVVSDSIEYLETVSESLVDSGYDVSVLMDPSDRWATNLRSEVKCVQTFAPTESPKPTRQRRWWNPLTWFRVNYA